MISKTCQRKGCTGEAKFLPVLHLYADRRLYPSAPPATMILGLALCELCAKTLQVDDVVSDEGWQQITESFRAINKAEPRREDIQVSTLAIDGPIVQAWEASVELTRRRTEAAQRHRDN